MLRGFVAPFYVAIMGIFYVYLSLRVVKMRNEKKVAFGDGGNSDLQLAIRAHANFNEYVPLCLLLLFSLDLFRWPAWLVHILGIMLVAARATHFFGLSKNSALNRYRIIGIVMTFTMMGLSSAILLIDFIKEHLH